MRVVVIFLILCLCFPVLAQQDPTCGNGLPCGSLPWPLPEFPDMPSPTPIDAAAAGNPLPPAPTSTPQAPAEIATLIDLQPLEDGIATMESALNATPISIEINGTAVSPEDVITGYVGESGQLFGYIKGLNANNLGVIAPLVNFSIVAMLVVFLTQLNSFIIPIALAFFGLIRKIITLILDFLPF